MILTGHNAPMIVIMLLLCADTRAINWDHHNFSTPKEERICYLIARESTQALQENDSNAADTILKIVLQERPNVNYHPTIRSAITACIALYGAAFIKKRSLAPLLASLPNDKNADLCAYALQQYRNTYAHTD